MILDVSRKFGPHVAFFVFVEPERKIAPGYLFPSRVPSSDSRIEFLIASMFQ
jgi:hypothetical protein